MANRGRHWFLCTVGSDGAGRFQPLVHDLQGRGTYDAGDFISRFDLATTSLVVVADLDNNTGKAAEGALLVISNEAYFTTVNGGNGNKGTIAKINLTNGLITVVHHFVTNGLPTGATPRGGLTLIGEDLWGMTSGGGVESGRVVPVPPPDSCYHPGGGSGE